MIVVVCNHVTHLFDLVLSVPHRDGEPHRPQDSAVIVGIPDACGLLHGNPQMACKLLQSQRLGDAGGSHLERCFLCLRKGERQVPQLLKSPVPVLFRPEIDVHLGNRVMTQSLLLHALHGSCDAAVHLFVDSHVIVFHVLDLFPAGNRVSIPQEMDHAGPLPHQADDLQHGLLRDSASEDILFFLKIIDDGTAGTDSVADLRKRSRVGIQFNYIPS